MNCFQAIRRVEEQVDVIWINPAKWPDADDVILVHAILHLAVPHCTPSYFGAAAVALDNKTVKDFSDALKRISFDAIRDILVLAGYQIGKSYREIASELHCKTKSVDNALARIKRKVLSRSLV